jgi:hypothetical protein
MTALWNVRAGAAQLPNIFAIFVIVALATGLCVRVLAPQLLFSLPRTRPVLWTMVMALYPILSVYPQSLVYRAFLMHRYAAFFATTLSDPTVQRFGVVLLSAAAFISSSGTPWPSR